MIDLGIEIEYTSEELRKRREEFLKNLERELEEKADRERTLCKSILKKIIVEFNKKAENEFQETFVLLNEVPIPPNLKLERVIELVREMFTEKGFEIEHVMTHGRTSIKVSWN